MLRLSYIHAKRYGSCLVYDLPPESLGGLTLKPDADAVADADAEATTPHKQTSEASPDGIAGSQTCSLCKLSFVTVLDQRSHIKSDLHHYNLKQKLRGQSVVTEAEFEKLIETLDESLSGSDSEDTEDDEDEGRQESTLTALLKKQARLTEKRNNNNNTEDGDDDEIAGRPGKGKPPLIWFSSPLLPEN